MKRGFSTVIAGGLIILVFSILATVYLLYLEANQYKFSQAGDSISSKLKRESETLRLYVDGEVIRIRNVGSIPVKIRYIAQKTASGLKFSEVNLTVDVGEEISISNVGVEPENLLFISTRGKVFSVDNVSGQVTIENKLFEWINSTYFVLNVPLNLSRSLYPLENSILTIHSQEYGYLVIDLYRGVVLYQGKSLIIPSRDGGILYVDGAVYLGSREVLNGYLDLEYVGYNYLVVSGVGYTYIVVSDGSLYTYSSQDSAPTTFYNGEALVIIGYIGEAQGMYRYYISRISPFNYSLISYDYLDLPIKISDLKPSNVYLPGKSISYLTSSTPTTNLIGVSSYKITKNVNLYHVFSSALSRFNGAYSWGFKQWYFDVDGGIKNSSINYVRSLSTLSRGLPMDWEVLVRSYETPYSDLDVRVYNLSIIDGFLSIVSELIYGYAGRTQVGKHVYKYVLGGDVDYLEIDVGILFSTGGASLNISVYSLYPSRELVASYSGKIAKPLISLDIYFGSLSGLGALHLYDKAVDKPYIRTLLFDFQKHSSNLLLKVINSTDVSVTSNYQFSRMSFRIYVSDNIGFYINPYTLDYLVDRKIDDELYISSSFAVIAKQGLLLKYVNRSISISVGYGDSTSGYASTYLVSLPRISWNSLSNIDSVGLYIVDESGATWYPIDIMGRYDWEVITYNLLYIVVSYRFGGVEVYVYKY